MFSEELIQGDVLVNIANQECYILENVTEHLLASYIVAIANSQDGGCIVFGVSKYDRTHVIGIDKDDLYKKYQNVLATLENTQVDIKFKGQIRGRFELAFIDIYPSESLSSTNGVIYTLINNQPAVMPEKNIIKKLGLGIDSDLINLMARQLSQQSTKIDSLQSSLNKTSSWKVKIKDWILGGGIALLLSYLVSNVANIHL
ncbi:RNA-binding domain-containing protein [Providencia rettgeri]